MKNPIVISDEWIDSPTAARELDVNERTVQKYAQRGLLTFKTVPQGRLRTRMYSAATVNKLRLEGLPGAPRPTVQPKVTAVVSARPRLEPVTPAVPAPHYLWLTLKQVEYTGLPKGYVLRLAKAGEIVARKTPQWRIQRASLEALAR